MSEQFKINENGNRNKITNTFSSTPVFRKRIKDYASDVGMNFSEAVRHLCAIGYDYSVKSGEKKD